MVPKVGDVVRFNPEFTKFLESRGDRSWDDYWRIDLEITSKIFRGNRYLIQWGNGNSHRINGIYIKTDGTLDAFICHPPPGM